MGLSKNQKLTLRVAFLSIVISGAVSGVGIFIQHQDLSKDRASRCNEDTSQFQSELSKTNDLVLKGAGDIKLGLKSQEADNISDVLLNYRRDVRLFDKKMRKHSCSPEKLGKINSLASEIELARNGVINESDFKLNKLLELSKLLAQDDSLASDCCN